MKPVPIHIAVEDELSEAVLRKILRRSHSRFFASTCRSRGGNTHLQRIIGGLNNAAKGCPCVVLTDLDREECAPILIENWLPGGCKPNLLMRVAVHEVESWIMADRERFSEFLGISLDKVPCNPDSIADPKELLINLARQSRRRQLREDIVPRRNSTARIGPDYNGTLCDFVRQSWRITKAADCSESLRRAVTAIREFRPTYQER